ncbi:MAG: trypsin-like peptidase domain-containing protein [gamma proteobacterium symbiont of Bathyaustriella thionipta]|nr:trypsin-like peptidase domain-containing protein [gamma proteobacterium symbiont of Bathyaustriella thionipta]
MLPTFSFAHSLHTIFKQINPTVVVIHIENKKLNIQHKINKSLIKKNVGSGVVISNDGKIMTASHLVHSADTINVGFLNGDMIPARVLSSVSHADVALIQLNHLPENMQVTPLGNSDNALVGDDIFIIGAPYGYSHTVSKGIISARYKPGEIDSELSQTELLQTDAAINRGNSGGPMFNEKGEVIAIVSHIISHSGGSEGLGFAVTSNMSKKLLLEEKPVWSGLDGIIISKLAKVLNVPQPAGYLVQHVAQNSIASRMGIQGGSIPAKIYDTQLLLGGDIIIEMLGIKIENSTDTFKQVREKLDSLKQGAQVTAKVLRSGQTITLSTMILEKN